MSPARRVHRLALLALLLVALIATASAHKHGDKHDDDDKHHKHEHHKHKHDHHDRADSHSLADFLDDSPHLSTFRDILMSKPARDIAHHLHKHEDKVTIIAPTDAAIEHFFQTASHHRKHHSWTGVANLSHSESRDLRDCVACELFASEAEHARFVEAFIASHVLRGSWPAEELEHDQYKHSKHGPPERAEREVCTHVRVDADHAAVMLAHSFIVADEHAKLIGVAHNLDGRKVYIYDEPVATEAKKEAADAGLAAAAATAAIEDPLELPVAAWSTDLHEHGKGGHKHGHKHGHHHHKRHADEKEHTESDEEEEAEERAGHFRLNFLDDSISLDNFPSRGYNVSTDKGGIIHVTDTVIWSVELQDKFFSDVSSMLHRRAEKRAAKLEKRATRAEERAHSYKKDARAASKDLDRAEDKVHHLKKDARAVEKDEKQLRHDRHDLERAQDKLEKRQERLEEGKHHLKKREHKVEKTQAEIDQQEKERKDYFYRKYAAPYEHYWLPPEQRTGAKGEEAESKDDADSSEKHHVHHGTKHHKEHGVAHHGQQVQQPQAARPSYEQYYKQYVPGNIAPGNSAAAAVAVQTSATSPGANSKKASDLPTAASATSLYDGGSYAATYTNSEDTFSAGPEIDASSELSSKMRQPYSDMFDKYMPSGIPMQGQGGGAGGGAGGGGAPTESPNNRTRYGRLEGKHVMPYPAHPHPSDKPEWTDPSLSPEERDAAFKEARSREMAHHRELEEHQHAHHGRSHLHRGSDPDAAEEERRAHGRHGFHYRHEKEEEHGHHKHHKAHDGHHLAETATPLSSAGAGGGYASGYQQYFSQYYNPSAQRGTVLAEKGHKDRDEDKDEVSKKDAAASDAPTTATATTPAGEEGSHSYVHDKSDTRSHSQHEASIIVEGDAQPATDTTSQPSQAQPQGPPFVTQPQQPQQPQQPSQQRTATYPPLPPPQEQPPTLPPHIYPPTPTPQVQQGRNETGRNETSHGKNGDDSSEPEWIAEAELGAAATTALKEKHGHKHEHAKEHKHKHEEKGKHEHDHKHEHEHKKTHGHGEQPEQPEQPEQREQREQPQQDYQPQQREQGDQAEQPEQPQQGEWKQWAEQWGPGAASASVLSEKERERESRKHSRSRKHADLDESDAVADRENLSIRPLVAAAESDGAAAAGGRGVGTVSLLLVLLFLLVAAGIAFNFFNFKDRALKWTGRFRQHTGNGHYAAAEPLIPSSTKSASGRDRQSEAPVTSSAAAAEANYQSSSV